MKKKKEVLRVVPCAGAALDPPLWTIRFLLISSLSLSVTLSLSSRVFLFFPQYKKFPKTFFTSQGRFLSIGNRETVPVKWFIE
jgi:hypothetical protein